jgi:hypothetical protein
VDRVGNLACSSGGGELRGRAMELWNSDVFVKLQAFGGKSRGEGIYGISNNRDLLHAISLCSVLVSLDLRVR